jgi:uroporphyrinogen-III synthase
MTEHGLCDSRTGLAGLSVLVTRPRHQSAGLAALIEEHGGTALRFPVIDILSPRNPRAAQAALASLDDYDWVIFISPNAVSYGIALMDIERAQAGAVRLLAVGESTAVALQQAGFKRVLRPAQGSSSEALLAMSELQSTQVDGARILIVKGEEGRPLLAETLAKRGAQLAYAEVYRRARPQVDVSMLVERGRNGGIDTIIITSVEGLENLFALLGKGAGAWLREAGYVVVSERLAARAREMGVHEQPLVAAGADDASLLEALLVWRANHSHTGI